MPPNATTPRAGDAGRRAEILFSVQDDAENSGSLEELQGFRSIAECCDALIRRLWRQQHGMKPCPLDRGRLVVIDGSARWKP
jgi:hypothetical protein